MGTAFVAGEAQHGDVTPVNGAANITQVFWIRLRALTIGHMSAKGRAAVAGYPFLFYTAGDGTGLTWDHSAGNTITTANGQLVLNSYIHIAWTYAAGTIRLYKNGVEITNGVLGVALNSNALSLSFAANNIGGSPLDADFSYIRMWSVALSPGEIISEMQHRVIVRTTNVILNLPYNDPPTLADISGNGWNAVQVNGDTLTDSPRLRPLAGVLS